MIYLAFACSGAAALMYEVAWTRQLTLFMGHTVAAASTVLAAFMGGLAIGAAVAGHIGSGWDGARSLRAYAVVEVLIILAALALPFELRAFEPLLASAYADGEGGATFGLVRLVCALVVVTIPAIAMGATLPFLIRAISRGAVRAGQDTAALYAANTTGATAGAILAGFVLLPAAGLRLTTGTAMALNAISAGLAWWWAARLDLARAGETESDPARAVTAQSSSAPAKRRGAVRRAAPPLTPGTPAKHGLPLACAALAVSGAVALVQQIAWTRILALTLGPTTYAFSTVVATFIAGIALGSLAGGAIARRSPSPVWLGAALLLSGVAATAGASYAPELPSRIAAAVASPDASFDTVLLLQTLFVAALMMPMAFASGAAFPVAVSLAARRDDRVARDVSTVYAANTIGAIAGALAAGFLLVPALGLQDTVRLAAAVSVAAGAAVAMTGAGGFRLGAAAAGLASLAALWLLPPWDRELLSSGAYKYAPYLEGDANRETLLRAGRLLYYEEGATGTVSVRRLTGAISLAIDGKVDASNSGDMLTQQLLAHVPLLLHPSPSRVGIIGLGSGVTVGSALRHPIERVDALELSPQVVEASRFFARENGDPLADRRTRLIVGDGRSHLLLGRGTYDVIISEPSNPWMAGVASLFTREFFLAARARLAPGGILCQWAHTYDISERDLKSIVATFTSVFPDAALWLVGDGDILLTGSTGPISALMPNMERNWRRPGVAADLARIDVLAPITVASLFALEGADLRSFAAGAPIQTDDHTALEFSAPRAIYGRSTVDNAAAIRAASERAALPPIVRASRLSAAALTHRGRMQLRAEAYQTAFEDFAEAIRRAPGDEAAYEGLLSAAAPAGRMSAAETLVRGLVDRSEPARVTLSRILASRGDFEGATGMLRPLFAPGARPSARAVDQLASIAADAGDATRLGTIVATMQRAAPDGESTLYYTASHLFMTGQLSQAAVAAERLVARNRRHARAHNLLGAAYATTGRRDEARRAFRTAIDIDPREPTAYTNLAAFELEAGNAEAARELFVEALTLDPHSPAARDGLAKLAQR